MNETTKTIPVRCELPLSIETPEGTIRIERDHFADARILIRVFQRHGTSSYRLDPHLLDGKLREI